MTVKEIKDCKGDRTADLARDLSSFETNFILLSGGLLVFSITFIKDIVKIAQADFLPCLFLGWALLATGMGIMIFAGLYSSNASHRLWKFADEYMTDQRLFKDETVLTDDQVDALKEKINGYFLPAKVKLRQMRNVAVSSFLSGLLCFSFFVGDNVLKGNKTPDQPHTDSRILLFGKDSLRLSSTDTVLILKRK